MHIKKISLSNFRNYEKAEIELASNVNIFIGNNAQGKTNLLEAIYVAGFGKSFRTSKDTELIKMDCDTATTHLSAIKHGREFTIDYRIKKNKKKEIKVNGSSLTKISELIGFFNIVIFSPEDLKLIKGTPVDRRKFIDRELSHISPTYCAKLIEYHKILTQRNNLLRQISTKSSLKSTLFIWNEKLSTVGTEIILRRIEFIEKLNITSNKIHYGISGGKEVLALIYLPNLKSAKLCDKEKIIAEFEKKLVDSEFTDIKRGFTSVGPHRDDMTFLINDIDIRNYGSQGQQRTAALSLKLSEIEIIKEEVGEYPILLLDDVMSELDIYRQNDLVKTLSKMQMIITTTDVNNIFSENVSNARIFSVNSGKIQMI